MPNDLKRRIANSIIILMALFLFVGCGSTTPTDAPMTEPTRAALETAQAADMQKLSATLSAPSPVATAGPSLTEQIDAAWGAGDWPRVVVLLNRASPVDNAKLYAAYFNYGRALSTKGDAAGAALQYQHALEINANGTEARQALLALTPTSVPAASATPVPAAPALTRAEAAALDGMGAQMVLLSDGLAALGPLMLNAKFTDEQWRMLVLAQMIKIRGAHEALSRQSVPPTLAGFQSRLLGGTADCSTAMELLALGMDSLAAAPIEQAAALVTTCRTKLGASQDEMVRLRLGL